MKRLQNAHLQAALQDHVVLLALLITAQLQKLLPCCLQFLTLRHRSSGTQDHATRERLSIVAKQDARARARAHSTAASLR